jgi:hypothetical protein
MKTTTRTPYAEIYTHNHYVAGDPVDDMRLTQLQETGRTSVPILSDWLIMESLDHAITRTEVYAQSLADILACKITTEVRGTHLHVQAEEH